MYKKRICRNILLILGCIIYSAIFFALNFCNNRYAEASNSLSFYEFTQQVQEIAKDNDLSLIDIEEDSTLPELLDSLNVEIPFTYGASASSLSKPLEQEEIVEICNEFGFNVTSQNGDLAVYSAFQLKRLIINGDIDDTYNASHIITGYKDYNILSYATEEETEYAYYQFIQDESLNVMVDSIIVANSDTIVEETAQATDTTHYSWGAEYMGVDDYIDYLGTIEQEVIVAVIDTGINTSHSMFNNRFLYTNGRIVGTCFHEDGTRYTYSGYSFEDDDGHGTHVAGTICDLTPENVKILPIKALNYDGKCTNLTVLEGIEYILSVTDKYKNIVAVNMSLGGTGSVSAIKNQFTPQFTALRNKNILPIVAAGNDHIDASKSWPACCENAVTVSALKKSGSTVVLDSNYSNYGTIVDIAAPGTGIVSAYISSSNSASTSATAIMQGTSMAAPHVSAAVALLCLDPQYWTNSTTSNYTSSSIEERLYDMAVDLGSPNLYGNGCVSLKNFNGNITISSTASTYTYDGDYHTINIAVSGPSTYKISYRLAGLTAYYEDIDNVVFNDAFKNVTNGQLQVYFSVSTTEAGYSTSTGYNYLTITPRPVTITINPQSSNYKSSLSTLTYSLTSGSFAYGENYDDLNLNLTTTATNTSNAGSYPITATYNNSNYNVTFVKNNYTILPINVTVTLGNATSVYGEPLSLDSVTKYVTGMVAGETIDNLNLNVTTTGISKYSDVGVYQDAIIGTYTNINYNVTFNAGDYTITARSLTISIHQSGNYRDIPSLDNSVFSVESGSIVNADDLGITMTLLGIDSDTPIGTYENCITVTYSNKNYNITVSSTSYSISPIPIVITILNRSITYGEQVVDDDTQYTTNRTILEGENLNIDLTINLTSNNAGSYSITGTYNNSNYNATFIDGTFTIKPIELELSTYQKSDYGNNIILNNNSYSITKGSMLTGEFDLGLTFSTSATNTSDVGQYPITLASWSNKNYAVTLTSGIYEIKIKTLTVTLNNASSVYGNELQPLSYTITYNENPVTEASLYNFNITLTCPVTKASDVGHYPITATNNQTKNYNITFINANYTINERILTITLNNLTGVYGEELKTFSYSITLGSLPGGKTISDVGMNISSTVTNRSNVGSYDITATHTNKNYAVTFNNAVYTITRRSLEIKTQQSSLYGENVSVDNNNFEVTRGSFASFDKNLGITFYTEATNASPIGRYAISMTYTNKNYAVTLISGYYYIVEKQLIVTIGNKTSYYGDEIIFDDLECSINDENIKIEDLNIEFSSNASIIKNVGSYTIEAINTNDNYYVEFISGTYTIEARPITISINQTSQYGDIPTVNASNYTIESGSIVEGDNLGLILTTTATKNSSLGDYEIKLANYNNKNYNITLETGTLTVTAKEITIKLEDCSSIYGNNLITPTYHLKTGTLATGNTLEDLNITVSTTATNLSPVGSYTISASYSNLNYDITFENATYSITKRPISIKTQQSGMFEEVVVLNNNLYSIISGSLAEFDKDLGIIFSTIANEHSPIGDYEITMTYSNTNYDITLISGIYSVTEKNLIVTIGNVSSVYGDALSLDSITYTSNVTTFDLSKLNITATSSALTSSSVGSYDITATYNNPNYSVTFINGTYTINPRPIVITTSQTSPYGQTPTLNNTYEIVSGNIVNNDKLNVSFTTTANRNSNAGEHQLTINNISNKNYVITLQSGILTITPRNIKIIINSASSIYGNSIANLTYKLDPNSTLVSGDMVEDLNITLSTTATSTSNVTKSGYLISGSHTNNNYNIEFVNNYYHINKRSIIVEIDNASSIYGEEISPLTYSVLSELAPNDTVEDLNITLHTIASKTSSVKPNGYNIFGHYDNDNYDIAFINGIYKIQPKTVSIIINNQDGIYGDDIKLNNKLYEVADTSINKEDLGIVLSTKATKFSPAGNYSISAKCNTSNYTLSFTEGTYTINKRNVTIKLNNQTLYRYFQFEVDQNAFEIVKGTVTSAEDFNLTIYTDAQSLSGWGNYVLTASCANTNYEVEIIEAEAKVVISVVDIGIIAAITAVVIFIIIRIVIKVTRRRRQEKSYENFYGDWIGKK